MAEEFYFQWQNQFLRETIYPRREVKLIDFLVYYKEIELWAQYKARDITGEIQAYHEQKKQAVANAVSEYYRLRNYFLREDARAEYAQDFNPVNEVALEKIDKLHATFKAYLPGFTNPHSENYFLSRQLQDWQQTCKDYQKQIASKQRRVVIMTNNKHPNAQQEQNELSVMEKVTPMLEEEGRRLNKYFNALSKIEKRKLALAKTVDDAGKKVLDAERRLKDNRQQMDIQEVLQKKSSDSLTRLKSPPDAASVKSYFGVSDVPAQIRAKFPLASQDVIDSLSGFRKGLMDQLSYSKSLSSKLNVIRIVLYNVGQYQKSIEKEILKLEADLRKMGGEWKYRAERQARHDSLRDVGSKAIAEEIARLTDFQSVLESAGRPKEETDRLIQTGERELAAINTKLAQLHKEEQDLQALIDSYDDILIVTEEKRLAEYVPDPLQPVTRKDIVRLQVDEFKACLEKETHYQLLQRVVSEFRGKPGRYPRWLQYMVIHFSGMRYASAHGSWADPRNLLASLRIQAMTEDLKTRDGDEIEDLCQDAIENYEPSQVASPGPGPEGMGLPHPIDLKLREQVEEPLDQLKSAIKINSASTRRNALIDLRTEEINYEVQKMDDDDVDTELLSFKGRLPAGMWEDIVRLTDLKVNQVTDKNWEKPVTSMPGQIFNSRDAALRQILGEWKSRYVTGWREEHDLTKKLIVTRAVCNEVAEHIQHLRGQSPDGGLTAKPKWYQRQENANPGAAYFEKPEKTEDGPLFKQGASILWLRFVNKEPNPWQVAEHVFTKKGHHGILPDTFPGKEVAPGNSPWSYNRSGPIVRTRTTMGEKGTSVRETQWLRWMHEATVAEVAETAEGTVVLTFETALPTDDPSRSAIGVFKHYLSDVVFDRGEDNYYPAFVGYVPEKEVPADLLKDMLDWDKIMIKTQDVPEQG